MKVEQLLLPLFGLSPGTSAQPVRSAVPALWKVGGEMLPLHLVRRSGARRYILRLSARREIQLTVPRSGSFREALEFLGRSEAWLARRLAQLGSGQVAILRPGGEVWFRGTRVGVEVDGRALRLGGFAFSLDRDPPEDLRPVVDRALRMLAQRELPARTLDLAAIHGCRVDRVSIRAQRSRWGSCSARGVISLNWRLVQTPVEVRDYIILHELMHLREMNHSERYWAHVESVCPRWRESERWLKVHGRSVLA